MKPADQLHRLAIDVGRTFTDFILMDNRDGKVLSTPEDASLGSAAGACKPLARYDIPIAAVHDVIHATSVAINAVLERKGAASRLITTLGLSPKRATHAHRAIVECRLVGGKSGIRERHHASLSRQRD